MFTQRIIRVSYPNIGWSPLLTFFVIVIYSTPFIKVHSLAFTVIAFYNLCPNLEDLVCGLLLFGLCTHSRSYYPRYYLLSLGF
ncbi:hypothetical protein BKA65DRAFT_493578 [Rhexocercosporidium sp. MPI-PUGE-AT-0058]|nr:hypothetical protein BKA65DRAFT_493578 [Rhexocercosporidium sp. MPI-PUGE-AT-0058]